MRSPWGLPPRPIHVVEQVWTEIIQHAPEALADPRLEREPVVELDPHLQAKFSLQSGETAAIAFALKHSGSLLLRTTLPRAEHASRLGLRPSER